MVLSSLYLGGRNLRLSPVGVPRSADFLCGQCGFVAAATAVIATDAVVLTGRTFAADRHVLCAVDEAGGDRNDFGECGRDLLYQIIPDRS